MQVVRPYTIPEMMLWQPTARFRCISAPRGVDLSAVSSVSPLGLSHLTPSVLQPESEVGTAQVLES